MYKKGMSLITLAVTIAIILLITGTVVISGLSSLESAKKTSFGIEIKNIQEVTDEYILKTGESVPVIKTVNLNTAGLSSSVISAQFVYKTVSEPITSNILQLNVIDLSKLGIKDTKYGKGETALDYYAISPTTNRVYYLAGIKAGGEVYYTLTDALNKTIGKNDLAGTNQKSVIFQPDKGINSWINSAVKVTVKVPEEYTIVSVVAVNTVVPANTILISTMTNAGGYNQYTVNTSSLIANYTITLTYSVTGVVGQKTAIYKITKVDGTLPTIATPTLAYNIDSATNIATAYISGINVTDDSSGIKSIKYAKGTVADYTANPAGVKQFFIDYGIDVLDNKIAIERGATSYSIYAEDNAGNIKVTNVTITAYIQSILY